MHCINILPVLSTILPVATLGFPRRTRLLSDEGIMREILNVSAVSIMLSLVTGTLIVVLADPTSKVVLIEVEE